MRYDEAGRLERSTDFEGRTTDYVYDELGRLDEKRFYAPGTSLTDPADEVVDYAYDAYGRVSEVLQDRDGSGGYTAGDLLTRHTYDPLYGRLTRVTTDQDGDAMTPDRVLNYAYDNATGRQQSTWTGDTSDSASTSVSTRTDHTYDRLGRLATTDSVKLAGSAGPGITSYRYDPVGNLQYVIGPAHDSYYQYDGLNRLTELTQFKDDGNGQYDGNDQRIATFSYTLADDGQREQVIEEWYDSAGTGVDHTNTFDWTYDNADRLVTEALTSDRLDDYASTYAFDLVGNRVSYEHNSVVNTDDSLTTYQYDKNDRLLVEQLDLGDDASIDRTTTYEYGGPTNVGTQQTRKIVTGDQSSTTQYQYNLQGRLKQIDLDEGSNGIDRTISYEYNDQGIRTRQVDGNEESLFLVDSQNLTGYAQTLEEMVRDATTQNLIRELAYVLGHDILAQSRSDFAAGAVNFLLYDGHGSTRGLVDAMGMPLTGDVYAYDAYGQPLGFDSDLAATRIQYAGERTDQATGLGYNRARFYNFSTGRFNRLDDFAGNSLDPQTLHKYLYGHGNPVGNVDPTGLASTFLADLGTAAHFQISALYLATHLLQTVTYGASIPGIGGARLPDIMNFSQGTIAEIKPIASRAKGEVQLAAALRIANGNTAIYRNNELGLDSPVLHNGPQVPWIRDLWSPGIVPLFPGLINSKFSRQIVVTLGNFNGIILYQRFPIPKGQTAPAYAPIAIERATEVVDQLLRPEFSPSPAMFELASQLFELDISQQAVRNLAAIGVTAGAAYAGASIGNAIAVSVSLRFA